jgi:hypothetical protein
MIGNKVEKTVVFRLLAARLQKPTTHCEENNVVELERA